MLTKLLTAIALKKKFFEYLWILESQWLYQNGITFNFILNLLLLTISDTGFFEFHKHEERGEGLFAPLPPPHPNFCFRAAVMLKPGQ